MGSAHGVKRQPHSTGTTLYRENHFTMRALFEITPDGDVVGDDGDVYTLFPFDPESLGDDPLE